MTPHERYRGVFGRRASFGSSSGEESPRQPRGPKCSRHLTPEGKALYVPCLIQPKTVNSLSSVDGAITTSSKLFNFEKPVHSFVQHVHAEASKDFLEDERPPSPRPRDELQHRIEHSKQMLIWDEWVMGAGASSDIALISYKRVESQNIIAAMPKALKPPTLEELDTDDSE